MQKVLYTFLLTCFLHFTSFAQSNKCDTIFWTEKTKLNWSNFKANPDTASPFRSVSVPGIGYKAQSIGDTLIIEIHCRFHTCKSWTTSNSENLLKHEQTHFDIAEYFKRIFIQKLNETHFRRQYAFDQIRSIYKEINRLRDEFDYKYDLETDFSRNKSHQKMLTIHIRTMVDKLKLTDKKRIVIYLKD